jgi:OPA family glycerol-3-phosphate transporter-like MFS transporter 1/2
MYWLPNLIHDTTSLNAASSANLSNVFDVGGIVGAVLAGIIFDWSCMGATTSSVMFLFSIPTLFLYQYLQADWCPISQINGTPISYTCYGLNVTLLLVNGILINGPFALIMTAVAADLGTHPSLCGSKNAIATVIAIINGAASIGSAVGPSITGWLTNGEDWTNVFTMMIVADTIAALLLGRIVLQEIRNKWLAKM